VLGLVVGPVVVFGEVVGAPGEVVCGLAGGCPDGAFGVVVGPCGGIV
jgi:hypothetical protein